MGIGETRPPGGACPLVHSHVHRLWINERVARAAAARQAGNDQQQRRRGDAGEDAVPAVPPKLTTGLDLLQHPDMYEQLWRTETTLAATAMTQYGLPKRVQLYVEHPGHTARAVEVDRKTFDKVRCRTAWVGMQPNMWLNIPSKAFFTIWKIGLACTGYNMWSSHN